MTGSSQSASCAQIAQLCAGRERIHHVATAAQSGENALAFSLR
ncbi:MAG TPA: hypothetical protein VF070_20200 [Streptosporangiaceae bacterium]